MAAVTVVLSHFHFDHVTGLGFVSARWLADRELTFAGPGSRRGLRLACRMGDLREPDSH